MARIMFVLRLMPCLLLAACGGQASDGQPPASSGNAAPARAATAMSAGKANTAPAMTPTPATTTAPAAAASAVMQGSLPLPVATVPGVTCTQKQKDWAPECVAGDYQISVYTDGCSGDGFYGEVHSNEPAVTLRTSFAEFPTAPVAKLRQHQFVCVAADAGKSVGERLWYYVMAIPAESVKACKGKELCGAPGQPPVEWATSPTPGTCRLEHGQYTDCAAGWVSADEFEEYSNGL